MKLNTKIMVRLALFAAISIVLGKFLQIPIGDSIRISFENLTIILGGYLYGPIGGMLAAVVADILGCMAKGYVLNPIITIGAAMIGFFSGVFGKYGFFQKPSLVLSVATSHIIGSMIIKSIGLYVYISQPWFNLLPRIPIYIAVGVLEYIIIRICINHKGLRKLL